MHRRVRRRERIAASDGERHGQIRERRVQPVRQEAQLVPRIVDKRYKAVSNDPSILTERHKAGRQWMAKNPTRPALSQKRKGLSTAGATCVVAVHSDFGVVWHDRNWAPMPPATSGS